MATKILGLIPARGGSKGVPRKNIKILGNKPLIAYTIEEAKKSKYLSDTIVSTDDQEIAEIVQKYGASLPFIRPPEISTDSVPMLDVIKHAIDFFTNKNIFFDAICLLQPTTPFRLVSDIDGCVQLMKKYNADTVITTVRVPDVFNPYWVYIQRNNTLNLSVTGETIPRRQDLPPAFARAGSVYLMSVKNILEGNSMYGNKIIGYEIPTERNVNIDSLDDWNKAEQYLKEHYNGF